MKGMVSLVMVSGGLFLASTVGRGQGSLTPSAAPAPTMRTLDQVEPRIPVDSAHTPGSGSDLYQITQPGSYYLTGDVRGVTSKNGITILTNNVTLDLEGYSLIGTNSTGTGIFVSGTRTNIVIKNGKISNWTSMGLNVFAATNSHYEDLVIYQNGSLGINMGGSCSATHCNVTGNFSDGIGGAGVGCLVSECVVNGNQNGINVGAGSTVVKCTANGNSNSGIAAGNFSTVTDCSASGNLNNAGISVGLGANVARCNSSGNGANFFGVGIGTGARSMVSDCVVNDNHSTGISTDVNCVVSGCTVINNGNLTAGSGIVVGQRSTVKDCTVEENHVHGISVAGDSVVMNCHSSHNGTGGTGSGIITSGAGSRIEGNQVRDNDTGITATTSDVVIRNLAGGNTTNYSPSSGSNFAPVQAPSTATNPLANIVF